MRWRYGGLCIAAALSGCADIQHLKGKTEIAFSRPLDGVQSLEAAAGTDPYNPLYQIDYLGQREKYAREFLTQAELLRAEGKFAEATAAYERVLQLDRGNMRATEGLVGLQHDLRDERRLAEGEGFLAQGKADMALSRAQDVLERSSRNRRAGKLKEASLNALTEQQVARDRIQAGRAVLDAPVTLQLRDAPIRIAFESISKSTGLNILLDRDVKQDVRVSIFVKDISVADAIDLVLLQNQLDKRVINTNTILIYPSNPAKQAEYEDLVIRTFQVTNADLKYLTGLLKTMLKVKEVSADERSNTLVIRDTPERIRLAARLIAAHDIPEPEVMLEVQVLEISSGRNSNLGIQPPTGITVQTPGTAGTLTLGQLRSLGRNDLLVSPLTASINFKLEDADARVLASPRIRARNREKARILIGDRVPTITNTVTPINTGASVVTGNVTYQDVGLKLEFESQVYGNQEVGIKVNLEVSNIVQAFTDPQGGRSYQIGTRNANTTLRLKDGETQVLGGLISDNERNTASLIPGLGHLPIVGKLFGNNEGSSGQTEIVLAVTPRILREASVSAPQTTSIFSGTVNTVRERPILAEPLKVLKLADRTAVVPPGSVAATPTVPFPVAPPESPASPPAAAPPSGNPVQEAPAPQVSEPVPMSSGAALPPPPPLIHRGQRN
ncbi:secretin N-terminal domain-containing protein [Ramlibacter tataouinensis]|uniref:Candidate secretin, general secretion pathway protein D n=1 Tax=Ramlibacter tataouinensis (strain ATCC BAA-407 / DSM 14655 / LMG 21543 / TTB310) TaxID=365046 RepID=F5Y2H8_RAMTT|nr:secretin N-terminal domain-containing protein [Ramlibacter tataouinensis]AEG92341.1 candidate secretin, general secretion pathway protein D [Ramlibacter tataouinensis TTB310]